VREAEAEAAAFQGRPSGTLRIHSRLMFGHRVIAPLIPQFQEAYPDINVELHLAERPAQFGSGELDIDVEIRIGPPRDPGLMQRLILPSERILIASPAYLEHSEPIAAPADLRRHRPRIGRRGNRHRAVHRHQ
jgi:DNA-binding transcriptional LysR family regulator